MNKLVAKWSTDKIYLDHPYPNEQVNDYDSERCKMHGHRRSKVFGLISSAKKRFCFACPFALRQEACNFAFLFALFVQIS